MWASIFWRWWWQHGPTISSILQQHPSSSHHPYIESLKTIDKLSLAKPVSGPGPFLLHKTLPNISAPPWRPYLISKPKTKEPFWQTLSCLTSQFDFTRHFTFHLNIYSQIRSDGKSGFFGLKDYTVAVGEESCCLGWLGPPTTQLCLIYTALVWCKTFIS